MACTAGLSYFNSHISSFCKLCVHILLGNHENNKNAKRAEIGWVKCSNILNSSGFLSLWTTQEEMYRHFFNLFVNLFLYCMGYVIILLIIIMSLTIWYVDIVWTELHAWHQSTSQSLLHVNITLGAISILYHLLVNLPTLFIDYLLFCSHLLLLRKSCG